MFVAGVVLIVGYCLVITWGQPVNTTRFLVGAVMVTLADNVVVAIATSLYTKLITPSLTAVWIGILIGSNSTAQFLGELFLPQDDLPYEVTLALIGASLLLMIPVYRFLAPTLYSPWSAGGLAFPTTSSAAAADGTGTQDYGSISPLMSLPRLQSPGSAGSVAWASGERKALLSPTAAAASASGDVGVDVDASAGPVTGGSTERHDSVATAAPVHSYHDLD